jgi:xanthine dehydrogenase YagR molybdenum-binding subunit
MPKKVTTQVGITGNFTSKQIEIADTDPAPWGPEYKSTLLGTDVRRVDGVAKVTGKAKYSYDINLPGMLWGKILRSPHPAAKVTKVDMSKASAMKGVHAVINLAEGPMATVRYAGWAIAAVAADSPELANDAIRAIKVQYETKPFVVDLAKAMKDDSPLVNEAPVVQRRSEADDTPATAAANQPVRKGNLNILPPSITGDVAKGFAEADVVLEATFATDVQTHSALETHGGVVKWDGDELTVYASTQGVFSVRDNVAQGLRIPVNKVRVITEYMGGGFGAKLGPSAEIIAAAKLAQIAKAPVKMMLDRMEEQITTGNRPSSMQQLKFGCKKDGKLTAIQLASFGSGGVVGGSDTRRPYQNTYKCANTKLEATDVYTNSGPASAQRAPGHPPGVFAMDSMMDMLAEKVGMDPIEFRKQNDPSPVRHAQYDVAAKAMGWDRRNKVAGGGPVKDGKQRGIGLATSVWYAFGGTGAKADIDVHPDGTVEVRQGTQDIGTGTRTLVALVAAEELTIPMEWVSTKIGDTSYGNAPGSGGSNTAPSISPAIRAAAFDVRTRLCAMAADTWKVPAEQVDLKAGKFFVKGEDTKSASWKQVCSRIQGKLSGTGTRGGNYRDRWNPTDTPAATAGVQIAEVEVDTHTGTVRVLKVVACHDCGRVINKLTAESQVIGGVIQAMGYGLMENRILDRNTGRMVNPDLEFYKIPCSEDIPEIEAIMMDAYFGHSSTEAIGLGEPPKVTAAAAIGNAIYNAIGVRIHSTPFTPDKVLAALQAKASGASPQKVAEASLPERMRQFAVQVRDEAILARARAANKNEREA